MTRYCRPTRFQMQFLGILHRILRSGIFNILMLVVGFGIGFIHAALSIHYNALANSNYEFITKIEQEVKDLAQLDVHYTQKQKNILYQLKIFKHKISHDQSNIDKYLRLNTNTNQINIIYK